MKYVKNEEENKNTKEIPYSTEEEVAEDVTISVTFKNNSNNPIKLTYYIWRNIGGINSFFSV